MAFILAPAAGLEPATYGLTVRHSTKYYFCKFAIFNRRDL